ncbi:DUF4114 domain-containing protein [Botrimarina sp.]|uniref:DUF4114 domain-containing protein n=1 Tax=Botrimarina sp. TaxID=2795802 RepID=UPI0032F02B76
MSLPLAPHRYLLAAAVLLVSATASAQCQKEVQSNFTLWGMPNAAPVNHSGCDDRAEDFNRTILEGATRLVEENLREGVEFLARGVTRLDEDALFLLNDTDRPVRVYFIHEGAGYRNTLGYSTSIAGSDAQGERVVVFPDVSDGTLGGPEILSNGDWVELGDFPQGTSFEFFIVRDAVRGGRDVFTNQDHLNPDGIQHLAAWLLGDRYVLLGFEDLMNGGDLDYNDVVVVVDLSPDLGQGPLALLPR